MRRVEWLFFATLATVLLIPALIGTVFKYACEGAASRARRINGAHFGGRVATQGAATQQAQNSKEQ